VPPDSVAELSCQKIIFDLQLADLPVQKIDLHLIDGSLRRSATLENARRTVQQLLPPVVDLIWMDLKLAHRLRDGLVALDAASATLALNPALCFFRIRLMSCSHAIGAF